MNVRKTPKKIELSTTFKCRFMAKICIFVRKWPKNSLKFFELTISDVFLPKNSISGAKNSLKGAGGLHQNSLEIEFIVVSGRRE